jgi:hypothetical protein
MGIPLPALGIRSPQFEGPLDQYRKVVQLRSLLQGQQVNQARLQQFEQQQKDRQLAQQEQQRTQSLFRETGGDWEEFFKKAPGRGISMASLLKMKESYRKDQQEYRAQSVEERAARKERTALYGNEAAAVLALPGDQRKAAFMQRLQGMVGRGSLKPQQAQQFAQLAQLPDEEFNRQLEMIQLSAVGATKLFETEEKREAEKAKRTTKQKEFQSFLKNYRETKNLPRNAKTEMQARLSPEWKAWQGKAAATPFAAFASGDPEQQRLARQWIGLQEKYRQATGEEKRQLDSINARFKREMEVIKAQIGFPGDPTQEQITRMEELLRKANEDYDAVLAGKAPKAGGADDTVSVISPDGVRGKIPRSQLEGALQQGYKKVE